MGRLPSVPLLAATTVLLLATVPCSLAAQPPGPPPPVRLPASAYAAPLGASYRAITVTVPTPGGFTLAGTLTLPLGASRANPVAAVVTSTGSGPQDRDEGIDLAPGKRYRIFRTLADSLARRGIAVLRMDDRGVGASQGDFDTATTEDFAADVQAGLAYLRTRAEIDGRRLGVVGHSEGGYVAPIVAAREPELQAIVLLAGPAVPARPILEFQLANWIRHDSTFTGRRLDSAMATIPAQIDSLRRSSRWYDFILDYDPAATLHKVRMPVLILNGGTDQQAVPDNAPKIAAALLAGGNSDITLRVFPGLNHLFIRDSLGFPGGYARLEPQVEPTVIGVVVDWLSVRLAGRFAGR